MKEPPPTEPPASIPLDHWDVHFETQDLTGDEYVWTGHPVEFEDSRRLFRANEVHYNRDTGVITASGHVYFRSFDRNEQLWCDHLEYNTESEKGKFYDVAAKPRPASSPVPACSRQQPVSFRRPMGRALGHKYLLYNGWVTNCKMPSPWWRMRGPQVRHVPRRPRMAYGSWFLLRKIPAVLHAVLLSFAREGTSQERLPHSHLGHTRSAASCWALGYFWAINRSYDVTYRLRTTSPGVRAPHRFRGKPLPGTDYDVIFYGVQDRGAPNSGNPPQKYGGLSFYGWGVRFGRWLDGAGRGQLYQLL